MGIDANGYCTQCRTYRGLPQAAPPLPPPPPQQQYPPAYELMNPSSGAPYAGPSSGAPYATSGPPYAGPTSGAPFPSTTYGSGYQQPPTQPGGYPGFPQPQPQQQPQPGKRNSFVVPLVALSATLVVLVVAIVVVAAIRSSGNKGGGGGQGNGSPGATSLVDSCVVGDWEETSHKEVGAFPAFAGQVTFNGKGALLHLKADGTGITDYGSGTNYTGNGTLAATGAAVTIQLKVTGTVTFDYRTNNNTMSFSNAVSKAEGTASVNGQSAPSSKLEPDTSPASYTCSGSSMTQTNNTLTVEYRKR
jgi:hypothetical protein